MLEHRYEVGGAIYKHPVLSHKDIQSHSPNIVAFLEVLPKDSYLSIAAEANMLQGYSIFTSDSSLRRYILIYVKEALSTKDFHVGVTC